MAEMESKFRITAQATGFQKLTTSAEKLAKAFQKVGEAGEQMGKKTAAGLQAQHAAMDAIYQSNRGVFGKGADLLLGRRGQGGVGGSGGGGGGGGVRSGRAGGGRTVSTGAAAAMRVGHPLPGGVGGVLSGAGYGGGGSGGGGGNGGSGGGGRSSAFAPSADRAAGSFTQGLLQGALPESFIERGPGAYRQAAGVFAGRMARQTLGAAGDFVQSAARGPDAVAGALSGIPLVGGLLATGLGSGIQAARGEAAAQGSFAGMMPYVDGAGGAFTGRLNSERSRLGRLGMQYGGMSGNQSMAAFSQAAAQAGGTTTGYGDERLARALQAQQGYGVDLGTSMRLLRGEDLGQTTGRGSANTLGEALGSARGLGLEGGEIGQYLRRMASNLEEVNRTGIKFSAAGQGDLERTLSRGLGGVAGTRAAELGQSLNAGINQLAQGGAQNSAQAMLLQAAGFDPERPETYSAALRNIEDPSKRAGYVGDATKRMRRSTRMFSPEVQAESYRSFMGELGSSISHTEAYNAVTSGALDANPAGIAQNMGRSGAMTDDQLAQQARSNTPLSQQREAFMANMDTRTGGMQLDAVQQADMNAKRFTTAVQGVGNTFLNAANSIADVGRQLTNFVMADVGASGSSTSFR